MKIAILQNKIGVDGRSAVVAEMTRVCNERGITPAIYTFTPHGGDRKFISEYGNDLRYKLRPLKMLPLSRGTAYQTPLLNIMVSSLLQEFDIILNSGRCPYFLPKGPRYIHYIHFPLEASLAEEAHFQNIWGSIYTFPLKILYYKRALRMRSGFFVANSQYTLSKVRKEYPSVPESAMMVIYPPCRIDANNAEKQRDIDVVSLGAFISDKDQLNQLRIAEKFPYYQFVLIGNIKSGAYFKKCRKFISDHRIDNVQLLTGASKETVNNILNRSKIFLHTRKGEHFGIGTVEAISRGCVPIVHDSGGLKETVPASKLRFETIDDACSIIKSVLKDYPSAKNNLMPALHDHIQLYADSVFREQLSTLIFKDEIP